MPHAVDQLLAKRQLDQVLETVIRPLGVAQIAARTDDVVRANLTVADDLDPDRLGFLGGQER